MLSRVADAMFWMSRYLERAEHIAAYWMSASIWSSICMT